MRVIVVVELPDISDCSSSEADQEIAILSDELKGALEGYTWYIDDCFDEEEEDEDEDE